MSAPLIWAVCPCTSPQFVGSSVCGGSTASGVAVSCANVRGAGIPDTNASDNKHAERIAYAAALDKDRLRRTQTAELDTLRARLATLSEGERSVVALVVQGRLNKQVAGDLGVSEITVKVRRARAMRKMQAGSLAELIKMAGRLKI